MLQSRNELTRVVIGAAVGVFIIDCFLTVTCIVTSPFCRWLDLYKVKGALTSVAEWFFEMVLE